MEKISVGSDELFNTLQHVNLVKVKFGREDCWAITPVLYATDKSVEVLVKRGAKGCKAVAASQVDLKFQKLGYEYLVRGEVEELDSSDPSTFSIKFKEAQKFHNLRKYTRFDTDLRASVELSRDIVVQCTVMNISKGGAMVVTDTNIELGTLVNIHITFDSGCSFTVQAKILRKFIYNGSSFGYGVEFVETTSENHDRINKEVAKLEREYLKSLNVFREHAKKSDIQYDCKIAILSYGEEESYEIREALVKLGAPNFEVYRNTRVYADFFTEESPRIVILDCDKLNEEITGMVADICMGYRDISVILLLPIRYAEENLSLTSENLLILYKPLIYNEFEQEIIKYL